MNDEILDIASERVAKAYSGPGASVSPAIIAIIIEVIKNVLAGCFQSGATADSVKKIGPLRVRLATMRALSNSGVSWFSGEGRKIVDTVSKVHAESTTKEISQMMAVSE